MKRRLLEVLWDWPKPYIFGTALHCLLDRSSHSRYGIIKRAVQKKYLLPLRRDFYLIEMASKKELNLFEVAPLIYGPSYVSFESALSDCGWIPEAVYTTTCATVKKSKEFSTPLGVFAYEHIPIDAFYVGVEQCPQKEGTLFIASPLKALADMIYARKRRWKSREDLCADLRVEEACFTPSDETLLEELIHAYPSKRVQKALCALRRR